MDLLPAPCFHVLQLHGDGTMQRQAGVSSRLPLSNAVSYLWRTFLFGALHWSATCRTCIIASKATCHITFSRHDATKTGQDSSPLPLEQGKGKTRMHLKLNSTFCQCFR